MENQHYRANQLVRVRCLGGTDIWTQKEIRGRVGLRNRDSTPTPKLPSFLGKCLGTWSPPHPRGVAVNRFAKLLSLPRTERPPHVGLQGRPPRASG